MKTQKAASVKSAPPAPFTPAPATANTTRKTWIKKTPVDVVLDQIGKQEKKVVDMRAAVAHEERELAKLQKAKSVLEGD